MANELKTIFAAGTTTAVSLAADLANAANSLTTDATQLDNSVLLYPYANAVLTSPNGFGAAPTAGGTVDLYMIQDDVDGTDDEQPAPAATDITYRARYVGSWVVDNQTASDKFVGSIVISLEGVKKARFFILNSSGQLLDYVATLITVKITPFTYAPA